MTDSELLAAVVAGPGGSERPSKVGVATATSTTEVASCSPDLDDLLTALYEGSALSATAGPERGVLESRRRVCRAGRCAMMRGVIRIHGYLISTWTRTACMTCVEKGAEYELVPVARGSPAHLVMHPFGRMPVLEADGLVIPEGLAIMGYLEEKLPGPALLPPDMVARARVRTWMSICGDYVYRDVVRRIPRDREPTDEELSTARTVLERIELLVGDSAFLVGDTLTLADLYLAPQVSNCREKAPQLLDGLSALGAWFAGIEARDSFQRTTYAS